MSYVIGIDGGGTKTAAVILDTMGRVVGIGEGGPSTYGVVALSVTRNSISQAVAQACQAAGLEEMRFSAAFLGLGNVVSDIDRQTVRKMAADMQLAPYERIGVDHDCRIALAGGLSGRAGAVLIAGTGTSCYGRNLYGETWRSGGWGYLIDDEGSSYWLGIQAMRAATMEFDGRGPATQLTQAVYDTMALQDMNELMNRLYAGGMTRTEIASLAPLVFRIADQGDPVAQSLIQFGCEAMADCVLAVARKLHLDEGPMELAVVGGLTNAGNSLFAPLSQAVQQRLPQCQTIRAELPPAYGAGLLALQQNGQELDQLVLSEIHQAVEKSFLSE
jgi:N-acetylglucosamine kinase-like BadF-type ATPase